jgi:hypothetical protein
MDYSKHYNLLIEKAKHRNLTEYYETHHIIPKCIGGSDDNINLVKLTPEEHYVAHQLLAKIHANNPKLIMAAMMMCANRKGNKVYGWLKRKHSKVMSELQMAEKNSQYGTRWIHSDLDKKSILIPKEDKLPEHWKEGRKINFNEIKLICKHCNRHFVQKTKKIYCSLECNKLSKISISQKIINENLDSMIKDFVKTKSITKTLLKYGIDGRKGNTYFSNILKQKGFQVLKRRNSYCP